MTSTLRACSFLAVRSVRTKTTTATSFPSSSLSRMTTTAITNNSINNMSTVTMPFPVTESIREKLTSTFQPTYLDVINESHMHNVPKNSETHFKVVVISSQFESTKSPLQRHRLVNAALAEELDGPVHALSIVAKTPEQWENNSQLSPSPNCQGGDGSLPKKK